MSSPYSGYFRGMGWLTLVAAAIGALLLFQTLGLVKTILAFLSASVAAVVWFAAAWAFDTLSEIRARLAAIGNLGGLADSTSAPQSAGGQTWPSSLVTRQSIAAYNGVGISPGPGGSWIAKQGGETSSFESARDLADWIDTLPRPRN